MGTCLGLGAEVGLRSEQTVGRALRGRAARAAPLTLRRRLPKQLRASYRPGR